MKFIVGGGGGFMKIGVENPNLVKMGKNYGHSHADLSIFKSL
jgi:hypothetical protein